MMKGPPVFCNFCGCELTFDALFCQKCGRKVGTANHPFGNLIEGIRLAAWKCADSMKSNIELADEESQGGAWYKMLCEFLFCFVEIADRWSDKGKGSLDMLGPALAEMTVEAYWPQLATATKIGMKSEFIQNLYLAQLEYAKCDTLLCPGSLSVQDTVVCRLGYSVAETTNNRFSVGWMLKVSDLLLDVINETGLLGLVEEASKAS